MPRRQRWTPVRGTANRIYEGRERLLVGALDAPGRLARTALDRLGLFRQGRPVDLASVREVLVLRLDRIGDVLMSLPALADLRAALPGARVRLAVGRWSEEVARGAPVDEVLVWSAPWVGRAQEGSESLPALLRRAGALRQARLDLALDLQGDVRANLLLRATGARARVGYANTGGAWLLTHVVPLDETVSWVEQNRLAVAAVLGERPPAAFDPLTAADRDFAGRLFAHLGLRTRQDPGEGPRPPLVGLHPSGGRPVKQWDLAGWNEVVRHLEARYGARVFVTGSAGDRGLAASVTRGLTRPFDLTGKLGVRETMAVIASLDLFLSPDTGPMHMACAVGTPSASVFGPSDPVRYFSGGDPGGRGRHRVLRADLWCSPCNLIRLPPEECRGAEGPECLRAVPPQAVLEAAVDLLERVGGFSPRPGAPGAAEGGTA